MKFAEVIPWITTGIAGAGVALTAWTLRIARGNDNLAKADREQVGRDGYYKGLVDTLLSERAVLLVRIDAQDKRADETDQKLEQMRKLMDDLHDAAVRDKRRIEQLQGELRQEKQLKASGAAMRARDAEDHTKISPTTD
jgi:hypothetical protein